MIPQFFALFLALFTLVSCREEVYAPVSLVLPAFTTECWYYDLLSNDDTLVVSYQVLHGGNFEVDFEITAPDGSKIVTEKQKKHSDFLLRSFGIGQYSFCFANTYGTAEKKVEITLEMEKDINQVTKQKSRPEDVVSENAIAEIDRNLNKISKLMNYLRAREWRNMSTVESTQSRIVWLSVITMAIMVGVSTLQATLVHFMFSDRRRSYV